MGGSFKIIYDVTWVGQSQSDMNDEIASDSEVWNRMKIDKRN
jgi:hypothetical protein